jgi:hypothetical protein
MHQFRQLRPWLITWALLSCSGSPGGGLEHPAGGGAAGGGNGGGASSGGGGGGGGGGGAGNMAGASAQAGQAGQAGSPHVVSACPKADDAAAGTWENITPPGVQLEELDGQRIYGTQAVLINPQDTANVYVGVEKQGLFKSNDCGASWKRVNTGRNGDVIGTGAQWSMAMDPLDPNVIFAVNGYGSEYGLWKTKDGGVNWDQLFPMGSEVAKSVMYNFTSIISMDPSDHLHLVVSFHADCTGAYATACQAETKDGGANWRLLKGPSGSTWEGAGVVVLGATTWLYAMPMDGLSVTTDSGATWSNALPGGGGAHYQLYHSKSGPYYLSSKWGILHSDDGVAWSSFENSGGELTGIVGTGKYIYASQQFGGRYYRASESNPAQWAEFETPGRPTSEWGGYLLAYDPDHKLLYSTNQVGGLWRVGAE